ncbi:glycosyl transferase [Pusillimonas sp. T2]|uniref:glycosyltransferase n=1 Tax=Pusillimonas sp. T2 TaxID=1548123 RepID=UPI000B9D2B43|nr:glycosyltransferase [Pusillimonas sp. T2]OXR49862.1 glycosyl transferase [Pusillimonas sp. T2]
MTDTTVLHIVHIISGLGHGGAETVLHRLLTAPEQKDRHTVISMTDAGVFGPRLREAGVNVLTLDMPSGRLTWSGLREMYRLLRQLSPDVVQTWMYHADLVGGVVARLAGIRAVSWGIRNSGANLHKASRVSRAIAWLCARTSGVIPAGIVACADNAAHRHKSWGYRANLFRVIPNGYDLSRWKPDPEVRLRMRSQLHVSLDTPLLGCIARWNPLKDHANLLAAVARSAQTHPKLKLVLVGHQVDENNTQLMSLIERHGLRDRVLLLGRRDDVPDIMKALDIHVLSSCAEGFPNVVAEAMAVGVANVVTDVGDASRIVSTLGWVAPAQNSEALSDALNQALAQLGKPDMATRLQKGRERVARFFSLSAMVEAYRAHWHELAGRRRLMFAINNPAFFLSHRLPLALAAREAGFDVHVATMDGPTVPQIQALGFRHHVIPMSRSGRNPFRELLTMLAFRRLFIQQRPAIVHAVTIKPLLYGGIAARLAKVPAFIGAVSGLGFVFTGGDPKRNLIRWAATRLYRLALGHPHSRVIFQNGGDRDMLQAAGALRPGQVVMIRGSGVDLNEFPALPEPGGAPVAIMVSRLLHDKGVNEFVEAARLTRGHPSGLRWVLVGSPDVINPASVNEETLKAWQQEGVVECLGERTDIAELYQSSHIAVLPSYREGLPKSLIEAAASGRAVVTTDVPGCRDAIEPGETGVLVPARDAQALADAVVRLAENPELRQQMGRAGRQLAERVFDIRLVQQAHLQLYESLLKR